MNEFRRLLFLFFLCLCVSQTKGNRDLANKNKLKTGSSCTPTENRGKYHVAVAFFGISRSLKHTLPSIRTHIFNVLDSQNFTYDIFWHTLVTHTLSNNRTGEVKVELNRYDVKILDPCKFSLEDQEYIRHDEFGKFLQARNLTAGQENSPVARKEYDMWKDDYQSIKNILCSYYSQSYLSRLIQSQEKEKMKPYDAIIVLRPDTIFYGDIDINPHMKWISRPAYNNVLWVPRFQSWQGYNDRMAFGAPKVVYEYLNRGPYFRDDRINHKNYDNGETFLLEYVKMKKIVIQKSPIQFVRIRADGTANARDLQLLNTAREQKQAKGTIKNKKASLRANYTV